MSNVCTDCESGFTAQGYILSVTTKKDRRTDKSSYVGAANAL